MSVSLRKPMTLAEFLEWEDRQEFKHEFDGFGPVAMTGVRAAHAAIQRNLITALTILLRGQRCQPYGSELKVEVAGHIRYPDAFVVCTPVAARTTVVMDPAVVFEILSERTMRTDLVEKNAEYRATPTIQRYVVLQQTGAAATVFSRRSGEWATDLIVGDGTVLSMPEIGIEIPLADIYEGVLFEEGEV